MKDLFNAAQRVACTNWKWVQKNAAKLALTATLMATPLLGACAVIEQEVPNGSYPIMTVEEIAQNQYKAEAMARDFNVWGYSNVSSYGLTLSIGNPREPAPRGALQVSVRRQQIAFQGDVVIGGTMDPRTGAVSGGTNVAVYMEGIRQSNGLVRPYLVDMRGNDINLHQEGRDLNGDTPDNSPIVQIMSKAAMKINFEQSSDWQDYRDFRNWEHNQGYDRRYDDRRPDYRYPMQYNRDPRPMTPPPVVPQQPMAPAPAPASHGPQHRPTMGTAPTGSNLPPPGATSPKLTPPQGAPGRPAGHPGNVPQQMPVRN